MSYGQNYLGSTVGGRNCSYAALGCYNPNNMMAKVQPGTTAGVFITPNYGAIGYDTLLHGKRIPGCGSYFNIVDAYGKGAATCSTSYTTRMCGGGCGGGGKGKGY